MAKTRMTKTEEGIAVARIQEALESAGVGIDVTAVLAARALNALANSEGYVITILFRPLTFLREDS